MSPQGLALANSRIDSEPRNTKKGQNIQQFTFTCKFTGVINYICSRLKKNPYELAIVVSITTVCLLISLMLLSRDSNSLVYYADAVAHLVISRSIFDSLNPGFLQLGSAYLPLAHILLIPFVVNDFMFHTGLAGTIVSSISTAITAVWGLYQ